MGRTLRSSDATFTRKDGTTFPVAFSSAPLQSDATIEGVVVVFRDATEEKKEEEALRRELAALSWVGRIRDALDEDRLVLYSTAYCAARSGPTLQRRSFSAWWTATAR